MDRTFITQNEDSGGICGEGDVILSNKLKESRLNS